MLTPCKFHEARSNEPSAASARFSALTLCAFARGREEVRKGAKRRDAPRLLRRLAQRSYAVCVHLRRVLHKISQPALNARRRTPYVLREDARDLIRRAA